MWNGTGVSEGHSLDEPEFCKLADAGESAEMQFVLQHFRAGVREKELVF